MLTNTQKDYRVCIIIADQFALLAALSVAIVLRAFLPKAVPFDLRMVLLSAIALRHVGFAVLWYFSMRSTGAYELEPMKQGWGLWRAVKGTLLFTLLVLAIAFFKGALFSRGAILIFVCLGSAFTYVFRHASIMIYNRLFEFSGNARVLFISEAQGSGKVQALFEKSFRCHVVNRQLPHNLLRGASAASLGEEVEKLLDEVKPDEVILVVGHDRFGALASILNVCELRHVVWHFVPSLDQMVFGNSRIHLMGGVPLISAKSANLSGLSLLAKRICDIMLSLALLLVALPMMFVIWIAVKLTSRGPAIFVQQRIGRGGKIFSLFKFRTMTVNHDASAHKDYAEQWISNKAYSTDPGKKVFKIVGDKRITPIGAFLRKYSLDELPQIFNVLKGDMSLVGPRPALSYEVELYKDWHKERLVGIPGLTGEWQVGGRYNLSFDEMVKLDLEYLKNWTPARDFKVLLKTVPTVLQGTGK